ncbi:hypothetical protein QJS04_geneDACA015605 [Acorus gramineus]|uniref:Uncharacterized protein n=1 Tax=Acorus gramineus TaxID=55184 RepID=A0AAV9AUP5_ACOGR|nr:hypothetical protein QJS04_geneDACA015605 [Acorus gramineus]
MASVLTINLSLHTHMNSSPKTTPSSPRIQSSLSCKTRKPDGSPGEEKERVKPSWVAKVHKGIESMGRGIRESLSPKQKGDWKDLVLMSLSFAVYKSKYENIISRREPTEGA